ncbi:MAG: hypothetical protein EPN45_07230 [Rhizobiaceae bacterium]|nr:MAG: hypothetical protein EPN45_07230 [Rhizobiaceae bacterium]
MRICKDHWSMCRAAIEERGMSGLVARDGKEATDNAMEELQGGNPPFDPLMSMNWHWSGEAMRCGGLYLMAVDPENNPDNEGHYCPICEFAKHSEGFEAKVAIDMIADQMADYARAEGLIPQVS